MAEETPQTPQTPASGTEGVEPKATQVAKTDGAAPDDDDEVVTIKKSSLKKLQSDSTKNFERIRSTEYQVALMAQKADIKEYLTANKEKFPDVETDDLLDAESEEDFEKLAGQTQARIDKAAQRKLGDLQKVQIPTISPKDKAARLEQLKESPGSASFQEMLALQSQ